ncbi:MAG TPA: hypothetical protein VMY42_24835 [Thermoguttaceae bacterium]|nr:hypothetical protein [Thermoguttaceae bacterium]
MDQVLGNPIFRPDQGSAWEKHKVTACQMIREGQWYVMFYIGFADEHTAQIGVARSRDGTTGWERHPDNPVIRARVNRDAWDYDACYKPYAIFHEGRWMLWYNGRKGSVEQIGLATHPGRELWPQPDSAPTARPSILEADTFQRYVEDLNRHDEELYIQHIDNAAAWEFLRENIPLFECPDKELEKIYYFRWWKLAVVEGKARESSGTDLIQQAR